MKTFLSWIDIKFLVILFAIIAVFINDTMVAKAPARLVDEVLTSRDPVFVVNQLAHADPAVSAAAKENISHDPEKYIAALLDNMADGGLNNRIAALRLLGDLKLRIDPEVAYVFLDSDVMPLAAQALRYLSIMGEDVDPQRVVDMFHLANDGPDQTIIVRHGARFIPDDEFAGFVAEVMSLPQPQAKLAAVEVAAEVSDEKAIRILVEALQYTDSIGSLAKTGILEMGEFAFPYLMEALTDGRSVIKAQAAELLGELGDSRAFLELEKLFYDPNPEVGESAGRAAGMLADDEQLETFLEMVKSSQPDSVVALAAINALGSAGYEPAINRLMQIAADPGFRRSLRRAAFRALGVMRYAEAETFLLGRAMAEEEEHILRKEAILTLGFFSSDQTFRFLRKTLRTDTDFQLRSSAARALGMMRENPEALNELITAADNERTRLVLSEIVTGIGEFGDPRGFEAIEISREKGVSDIICDSAIVKINTSSGVVD